MDKPRKINRCNDALVKYIFAYEERKGILLCLINSILDAAEMPRLDDICYLNPELNTPSAKGKSGRVDILSSSPDGTIVNVEFQRDRLECMGERSIFYWAYIYRLKEGQDYNELPRTLCINILDFMLFSEIQTTDYCNSFGIVNLHHHQHILTKTFEMHFVEIPKWKGHDKPITDMTLLDKWMAYFSPKTDQHVLMEIARQTPEIAQSLATEELFMSTPSLRYAYDSIEKDRRDAVAHEAYWRNLGRDEGFQDGEKKGFQDGEKKGQQTERLGIVANMIQMGMSFENMSKIMGLSVGDIKTLAAEIQ